MAKKPQDPNQPSLFDDIAPAMPIRLPVEAERPSDYCLQHLDHIHLFRSLFVGRDDVYAQRWENPDKSGYAPACHNEWVPDVCGKKGGQVKCSECPNSRFKALTDEVIARHLRGLITIGTYALLFDNTCRFLAADFDEETWRDDVQAYVRAACSVGMPVYIEVSRSGEGAHTWIFFETKVTAAAARELGTALVTLTCKSQRQLKLSSYDRLFPSQDVMPSGHLGNLIALPLQGRKTESGGSVFVDNDLVPYQDQWALLEGIHRVSEVDMKSCLERIVVNNDPLEVAFLNQEKSQGLIKSPQHTAKLMGPLPQALNLTIDSAISIKRADIPLALEHALLRLACFKNKKYYVDMMQGFYVGNTPRVIQEHSLTGDVLRLPRGLLDTVQALLASHGVATSLTDNRAAGSALSIAFKGVLREDQQRAFADMVNDHDGVLCAPPGFGKTVICAALIAYRGVSTLIIVNSTIIVEQWVKRLVDFLDIAKEDIGRLVGGKGVLRGRLDVACDASLAGRDDLPELLVQYGQIIIDECHHSASETGRKCLEHAQPRYILGATAEDERSDGHQPLVFMRCGPIRHRAEKASNAPTNLKLIVNYRSRAIDLKKGVEAYKLYQWLLEDHERTQDIVADVLENYARGRVCLVLTQRIEHVRAMAEALEGKVKLFALLSAGKGPQSKTAIIEALAQMPHDEPHVLISTTKMIGEAFDHLPLNTLFLAMPCAWKGMVRQNTGRLDRPTEFKLDVTVHDYVDVGHPSLINMWNKRRAMYKKLGYRLVDENRPDFFD
ncbi:TOTE conflict system archaeo-eukaryotic primase domain-containing protein [Pseudomonas sp. S1(2024)]|uniref:TOTE conflict system archaeo-eukaryotic primase domain-containing protein n=1 Tax=Pseudomonas sp. S1(2024) TaxID=3390191 RepID=UPI00397ACE70